MAASNTTDQNRRQATLKLAHGPEGQVLTARVPSDMTDTDFAAVGHSVLGLIKRLTNCTRMSGRIKVVIEDDFAEVIRVDLNRATTGASTV